MGVKGGKRPEAGFPRGKVDVLRGASFVTDWRFSRLKSYVLRLNRFLMLEPS